MISKNWLTQGIITTNVCAKFENKPSSAFWVIVFTPFTVETLSSTIPYTTIFYITWQTQGPQHLQRPIRILVVLLGFWIKQIFV